jgi:hypothetical protein
VGAGVSDGARVGVSVGEGVKVADGVDEGKRVAVHVGVIAEVGETIRFNPPHAMSKRASADMQTKILLLIALW